MGLIASPQSFHSSNAGILIAFLCSISIKSAPLQFNSNFKLQNVHVREQSYNRKFPEWNLKFPALEKLMIEGTNLLSSQQLQDVVARCSRSGSQIATHTGTDAWLDGESPLQKRWSVVETILGMVVTEPASYKLAIIYYEEPGQRRTP